MNVFEKIKQYFSKGGNGMILHQLNSITDHPKIGINANEYQRIKDNLMYFEGNFPNVEYKNSYGNKMERPYVSLNMAQVSVRRLSSILFNEKMTFEIVDKTANDYVHDVFSKNDFIKNFERYLESALALGGLAMRPYVDGDNVKIAYIQAPVFYPLQSNVNDISEAAIVTKTVSVEGKKNIYWTLIEFHSWSGNQYNIDNELYRSDDENVVGNLVQLQDNETYATVEPHVTIQGLSRPLFVYLKPFGFNNKDITSPLGLSIFDNAQMTLKQINDAYDQFNWELLMSKKRIAVPKTMIKSDIDDRGRYVETFDVNEAVYISTGADGEESNITDMTTDIRSASYIDSINQFIKTYELQTGLSSGTFSFDAQGLKTATEVVSENSMTYQTRNSHLNNVERAIQELVISILELSAASGLYKGSIPTLDDIKISFDDGVFTDKSAQLDYYTKAVAAGVQSKKDAIMKLFNVSETEAKKTLAAIQDESAGPMTETDNLAYQNGE